MRIKANLLVRRCSLFAVSAFIVALSAASASADTFGGGPPDEGYEADSSVHTYCWGSGFGDNLKDEANYAMNTSLDSATDMSADFWGSCDSTVDVKWLDADLPAGVRGQYQCTSLNTSTLICTASKVTLDPAELNKGTGDHEDKQKTACHEVGHSVGLQHGDSKPDCMRNGEIPDLSLQWRKYSDHHRDDHINPTY